jgi:hypothetical protein
VDCKRDSPKQAPRQDALGPSFKPPRIPSAVAHAGDGSFGWVGVLLYAALAIAGGTMLLQVARFVRGSWNP